MRALSIRSLRKTFLVGPSHCARRADALTGVDLEALGSEILGIVGASGAGKTTLLLCAAGILRRDSGRVSWFGESFAGGGCLPGLAYVPSVPTYYPFLTVRDVLDSYCARDGMSAGRRRRSIDTVCAQLGLREKLSIPIAKLGLSELKRLGIAQAIVENARVILLDGTLDGLGDATPVVRATLCDASQKGATIIAASREPGTLAEVATRMVVMDAGRVMGTFAAERPLESVFAPIEGEMLHIAERMH